MKKFELTSVNGRKSFNKKCEVLENLGVSTLFSYGTEVAQYDHNTNEMKINDYYSAITLTHINSFLAYYGFEQCTKKQLEKFYLNK